MKRRVFKGIKRIKERIILALALQGAIYMLIKLYSFIIDLGWFKREVIRLCWQGLLRRYNF